ncbi:MAG: hypothetical protein AB1325_13270 [Nitrospirota bacterium]
MNSDVLVTVLCDWSVRQWYNLSASFSTGIQPFSEAKTARLGIHATLGLSKSLQDHTIA